MLPGPKEGEEVTLVEAAGVEPASESSGSQATTCLSPHSFSSVICLESRDQ